MDPVPAGLQQVLNEVKKGLVQNGKVYAEHLPTIMPTTTIGEYAQALFGDEDFFKNAFMPELIQRVIFTSVENRIFKNPLESLKNGEMPLGGMTQRIQINRIKGRQFDVNDFAGLLAKYSVDIKVVYNKINWDHQYPASITYDNIRDAFTSWGTLYNFTDSIAQMMYNSAYMDDFAMTKYLISNAYRNNQVIMQKITAVTDETSAKGLVRTARGLYSAMKFPSIKYNSWNLNGGYGDPITTWTNPEDIVFFIRADLMATVDVDVLARAFNLSSTEFLGRVYEVDNFDIYDMETGKLVFDGSPIQAAIGDRRWFDIQQQMRRYNQQFLANNEVWQLYLHVRESFNTLPFANFVLLVTKTPTVKVTGLNYNNTTEITMTAGKSKGLDINVVPVTATSEITYTIKKGNSATTDITLTPSDNGRHVQLAATASASGTYTLTASADSVSTTLTVKVTAAA